MELPGSCGMSDSGIVLTTSATCELSLVGPVASTADRRGGSGAASPELLLATPALIDLRPSLASSTALSSMLHGRQPEEEAAG
eukprot:CAMPEP_0197930446 /NCGR_PEP_ID=MMETSP1439-20131203/105466_1 /TAXON_ID=66791 /ORGANISM="Gonyaulax spinifera, Strain CCMP409" /LENGTH=82 /DNA_ID=CAMNT_0043553135 /DNA_START=87 /DNA_END=331 /DNA_ORIENTATION=-